MPFEYKAKGKGWMQFIIEPRKLTKGMQPYNVASCLHYIKGLNLRDKLPCFRKRK